VPIRSESQTQLGLSCTAGGFSGPIRGRHSRLKTGEGGKLNENWRGNREISLIAPKSFCVLGRGGKGIGRESLEKCFRENLQKWKWRVKPAYWLGGDSLGRGVGWFLPKVRWLHFSLRARMQSRVPHRGGGSPVRGEAVQSPTF